MNIKCNKIEYNINLYKLNIPLYQPKLTKKYNKGSYVSNKNI